MGKRRRKYASRIVQIVAMAGDRTTYGGTEVSLCVLVPTDSHRSTLIRAHTDWYPGYFRLHLLPETRQPGSRVFCRQMIHFGRKTT